MDIEGFWWGLAIGFVMQSINTWAYWFFDSLRTERREKLDGNHETN